MKKLFTKISLAGLLCAAFISPAVAEEAGSRGPSAVVLGSGGTNAGGQGVQPDEFTGAATYSITLPVPPARGGVEPQLILNYNSNRKNPNSWVGYGWELDLGSIERTAEPCDGDLSDCGIVDYYEGTNFQVRFSGQTESLDFKATVDAGDYGLSVSSGVRVDLYQAKIESAFNLYFHLVDTSGASYRDEGWIVIDKSGRRYDFGRNSYSNYSREDTERCAVGADPDTCTEQHWVARWMLESVTDPNNNTLTVTYHSDRLPDTISYQDITIEFRKNTARAYYPTFRQGFLDVNQMGVSLSRIEINQNGSRLQKFEFDYDQALRNKFYYLSSLMQIGADDSETLPSTTFEYYEGDSPEWDSAAITRTASTNNPEGTTTGYLNEYTTLADMNGDGLVDLVASYEDQDTFYVYYNDGNNFVEIPGKSEWTEPFTLLCWWYDDDVPGGDWCKGRINFYHVFAEINHQGAFLMDMNGDSLPDRVVRSVTTSDEDNSQASFYIAFNDGNGWGRYAIWLDPYIGYWPGVSDGDKWFMDMNGDGLIDRVVSAQCDSMCHNDDGYDDDGFLVYYNTGAGFVAEPVYWRDPIADLDSDYSATGRLSAEEDDKVYVTIKDFNGDGLPDRIWRTTLYDGGTEIGKGIDVSLNRNGLEWAGWDVEDGVGLIDGIDNLGIEDPVTDGDRQGYISHSKFDLMDINADGYLDRVDGDTDNGKITVYFYDGMYGSSNFSTFSSGYEFDDPVQNYTDEMDGAGYINRGEQDGYEIRHFHTFTTDMNGDGYPDRVTTRPRDDDTIPKYYYVYPMRMEAVEFSDSPSDWDDTEVNQPLGALKEVDDGAGNELAVEYLPSTWPLRTNSDSLPFNNRFLPFNLYLAHKVYSLDYTMPSSDSSAEAARWPGKRWTTYTYWGGNLFLRYAERTDPSATDLLSDGEIDTPYFVQFSGFQTVEKEVYKASGETWDDFITTTIYHQAKGDVDIVDSADETSFEQDAYDHFGLSGKVYSTEIATDTQTVVLEENDWDINGASGSTFECNGACFPYLASVTKKVWEEGATTARTSKVESTYDNTNGNLTGEKYYDGSNNLLLEKATTYYDKSSFDTGLQMQDRPQTQSQKDSGGTEYRYKEFAYDSSGNPTTEIFKVDSGGTTVSISRSFNSTGTVADITDIDGVTKTIAYDTDGLFPETETVTLPTGGTLSTTREFNRLSGEASKEINDYNIGKQTEYDDFGRPIAEYVLDSGSGAETIKEYSYEYVTETVEDWGAVTLLKTQIWEIMPGYTDTETNPAQIAYTDGAGNVLQQCTYTERGDYRLIQFRQYNGGREEYRTEPVFSSGCDFISTISSSVVTYLTEKDIQGRPIYVEPPDGDTNSPIGTLTVAYSTDSNGYMVKTSTTSDGRTKTETFDYNERLIEVEDADGKALVYDYNPVGDLETVTGDGTLLTTIAYDLLGRKTSMTDADMGTWVYAYDSSGRLETQTDNAGQYTKFIYDSIGRVTTKEYYKSDGTRESYETYTYDAGDGSHDVQPGELFEVEEFDASGASLRWTKYGYDSLYRRVSVITRNVPDVGELGQTVANDYRGRVTSASYPGGESLYYTYDRIGNMEKLCSEESCDSSTGEIYYSIDSATGYNVYGALLKESFGNGVATDYSYYSSSHRMEEKKTSLISSVYSQRTYTYDIYANLLSIGDSLNQQGSGGLSSVTYDDLNRITDYQQVNTATAVSLTYDSHGNITKKSDYGSSSYEYTSSRPHAVTKIGSDTFDYDANGSMTSDPNRTMEYNSQNRLTKVTMKNGMTVDYEYDYTGARVKKKSTRKDPLGHTVEATTHYLGDAMEIKDDQLILHIHVRDRRIATKNLGSITDLFASGGSNFVFAGLNPEFRPFMLTPFFLLAFAFFTIASFRPIIWRFPRPFPVPVGANLVFAPRRAITRIAPTIINAWSSYTRSLHDALHQLHRHRAFKLAALALVFISTVHYPLHQATAGDTGTPATSQSDETYFYYYQSDHLGSGHILTEGNSAGGKHAGIFYNRGELLQRIEYAPFGQELFVLNPNLQFDPRYTDHTYDIETGLYYMKARYYDPLLGRFTQPDTVVPEAKDLQAYNRYSYVMNNPLKYTDPSGHGFWSWFKRLFGFVLSLIATIVFGPIGGLIASVVYSTVLGAISGGIIGAFQGLALGGFQGIMGMGFGYTMQGLKVPEPAQWAIVGVVGAGVSYATGGWKGLVTFGITFAATLGYSAARKRSQDGQKYEPFQGQGRRYHLDYRNADDIGSPMLASNDANGTPNVASDTLSPAQTPTAQALRSTTTKGYLDIKYIDLNISISSPHTYFIGITFGFVLDPNFNWFFYLGGGFLTPGVAITGSANSVSAGWNMGLQAGAFGFSGQGGYSFSGAGNLFFEGGAGLPGAGLTGYYIWDI